ncbi:MAG: hypothetical protein ACLP3R_06255 [Candidatus Korobacteraceae bacterium]
MTVYAEYLTIIGVHGFKPLHSGDFRNQNGDDIQIMGDRARVFLRDGRVFTLYSPDRLRDLLRRLYAKPADSDPTPFALS